MDVSTLPPGMRALQRDELGLVAPRFRAVVLEAWESGEEVPYGITRLIDRPPTERERRHARELEEEIARGAASAPLAY